MKAVFKIPATLSLLVFALVSVSLINQAGSEDPVIEKLFRQTEKYRKLYPQQKVYVQTDKDLYQSGEVIWMKAYVTDGATLQPDTISKEIFVELLDQGRRIAGKLILRNHKGYSDGYLALKDTLTEGNYQLRAYTNWMCNFDPDYFFLKTISIKNPGYDQVITKSRLKYIKDANRTLQSNASNDFLTFFPEGGTYVSGLSNLVAFKAENGTGHPLDVKGTIMDNSGNEIVSFASIHDGMGTFRINPKPDIKYTAKITFSDGQVKDFPLPEASPDGLVISVDPSGKEDIRIIIRPNGYVGANTESAGILIAAQSEGQIVYVVKGKIKDKPVMSSIPKKVLPEGISEITIFSEQGEPLCERLVFIRPETGKGMAGVDLTPVSKEDSVIYHIQVNPATGKTASGSISMSIKEFLPQESNQGNLNILSSLLLTSELKGRIHNPSNYFDSNNSNAEAQLDLVMLTHGWRKFVWEDLLADRFPEINYTRVGGISLSGIVFGDKISDPIPNAHVTLTMPSQYDFKIESTTDSKGKFQFPMLEYEENAYAKIESIKDDYGKAGNILLDRSVEPNDDTYPCPVLLNENYDQDKIKENTRIDNQERKKTPAIKVSKEDRLSASSSYGAPTTTLKIGEDALNYNSIIEYLRGRIAGVDVQSGNRIVIRGPKTFNMSSEPLLILDGVQADGSLISSLKPRDIDRIEVFKGAESATFGTQGANGVLIFYTKHANIQKRSSIELNLAGYHKTRAFYVPPYESWAVKPESIGISKTLYWNPNIPINARGEAVVRFKKKSASDKVCVTLEGLTDSGEIIYKKIQD
jgi:hypothetical protein